MGPYLIYAIDSVATQRAELNSEERPIYFAHVKLETESLTQSDDIIQLTKLRSRMSRRYDVTVCLIYQPSHILVPGRHLFQLKFRFLKHQQVFFGGLVQIVPLAVYCPELNFFCRRFRQQSFRQQVVRPKQVIRPICRRFIGHHLLSILLSLELLQPSEEWFDLNL